MTTHSIRTGRSTNAIVGGVFGAVYLLVGLLGFTVSGGHAAAGHDGGVLLGVFGVNVLHNVVHLAIGAALLGAALAGLRTSRAANRTVGAVYLLVGVIGLFSLGASPLNILALNGADNLLHLASGAILLAVGVGADRR
jgi:hypothetical protein